MFREKFGRLSQVIQEPFGQSDIGIQSRTLVPVCEFNWIHPVSCTLKRPPSFAVQKDATVTIKSWTSRCTNQWVLAAFEEYLLFAGSSFLLLYENSLHPFSVHLLVFLDILNILFHDFTFLCCKSAFWKQLLCKLWNAFNHQSKDKQITTTR